MLPPATLAALRRLIAILLALVDALAAPVDGVPRPLVTRLAIRVLSARLERLAAQLTAMADGTTIADPTPTPHPPRARRLHDTPTAPRTTSLPAPPRPAPNPLHLEIARPASRPSHARIITI